MLAWFASAKTKLLEIGAAVGALAIGLFYVFMKGKEDQKTNDAVAQDKQQIQEQQEVIKQTAETVKQSTNINSQVAALKPAGTSTVATDAVQLKDADPDSSQGRLNALSAATGQAQPVQHSPLGSLTGGNS